MRICIPITAATTQEALTKMKKGFAQAGMLELRIDGIQKVDLKKLLADKKGEVIVTNRVREEGGAFAGGKQERVALLKKAVALGCDYVDLEIRTEETLILELKKKIADHRGRTRLILSYHNQQMTPGLKTLRKKMIDGYKAGADIVKIVTFAKKMEDNLKVLGLIPYAQKKGLKIIAFCMGEKGKISRIMAPMLGSYLTYASLDKGEESAPGQMTVEEIKQVLRILDIKEKS
ncbi:MAG: type I 3-dehydroquinate dehydratase [Thermodesulfobacteriota bacterium]